MSKNLKYNHRLATVFIALALFSQAVAADEYRADDLVIVPIESVEVPATRSGRITDMQAKPGDEVSRGELIGSMDHRHASLAIELAESELQVAQELSGSAAAINAADSQLQSEKQAARQLLITRDIAKLKAENDLRVLAAKKSEAVAENEYRRAADSRKQYAQSISKSEIESLKLVVDKSRLESKQAQFEKQVAGLEVKAETEAARRQALEINHAEAEVSAAKTENAIAKLQTKNRQIQLELAKASMDDHRIIAPIDGRITRVYKSTGAWANEGESIARIVLLDRLRIEGFAPVEQLNQFRADAAMDVEIEVFVGGETIQRTGKVVFIDPEIDPVSGEFRYWIDFENADKTILPGMRASARIRL
ncbi:efflux RND transporter periplasmic adaptor subunit [Rubripirellula obstinata]|nr:efflux RND transporter periplasmic adaptor subunit [Rubripirellula obstinata]